MGTAAVAAAILLAGCGGEMEEPVAEAPSSSATQEEEASPSPTETSEAPTTSSRTTSTYRAPAPVEEAPAARETSEEAEPEEEPVQESASRGCDAAFGNAQRALERAGTLSFDDVRPAMMACQSMDDWVLGAQAYPEVLGEDVDPVTYATNQCQYDAQYRDALVCEDVSGS